MSKLSNRQKEIAEFRTFFDAHWQFMYVRAFAFLKDKDRACALIQSIFVDLLQTNSFKEERDWENYLFNLLKEKILEQMRYYLSQDKRSEKVVSSAKDLSVSGLEMA